MDKIQQFQAEVISTYVKVIIKDTTNGIIVKGLEKINPKNQHLYISNHRDILLDPAILQVIFFDNNYETTEIAIGDNLLIYPWIEDIVKLNKTFIVNRNIPKKQALTSLSRLSLYIRYTLTKKKSSIWIAQREGRSKDGNDRTQISLLKMLNISGSKSLIQNFKELKIIPLAISYEYDPCDYLKAIELLMKSKNQNYKKTKEDDLTHMKTGLCGQKGGVHYYFGNPLNDDLQAIKNINTRNEQLNTIAELIDTQIHTNYNLWQTNYIAYDIATNSTEYTKKYTNTEKSNFIQYLNNQIKKCNLNDPEDIDFTKKTILDMYANPVINKKQHERP
jgi:1-acyl-sn-glycerol-3-phosphate acyltransferase